MSEHFSKLHLMAARGVIRILPKRPGDKKVGAAVDSMIDHGVLIEGERAHERGGSKPIGTPEQMEPFTRGGAK